VEEKRENFSPRKEENTENLKVTLTSSLFSRKNFWIKFNSDFSRKILTYPQHFDHLATEEFGAE